jgi:RimJ/RimL family protein N-acetyltransferase/aryl carrier-like protein
MTTVNAGQREVYRKELAALLALDVETLADEARLSGELALDSLSLMRVLTWAEARGAALDVRQGWPETVGELLTVLDKEILRGMSITVGRGAETIHIGPSATARPPADPLAPVLATRALRLDHIAPDDMGFLYTLAVDPQTSFRWRYRGAPPPYDKFLADLWTNVLVQFVVHDLRDGRPVGLAVAYGASPSLSHASVGAVFRAGYAGTGLAAQAVELFARALFKLFPLRKLYLEIPGYNWPQLQSGEGKLFELEGRLRDHYYYAGRLWDQYLGAIYPDAP